MRSVATTRNRLIIWYIGHAAAADTLGGVDILTGIYPSDATVSGASSIGYLGNPAVTQRVTGPSSVRKG